MQHRQLAHSQLCSYSTTTNNLKKLTAKVSGQVQDYFELNVQNFMNPSTTAKTPSFIIETYDASNKLLDNQNNFIFLQATPDTLSSLTLKSSSDKVGDTGQELTISIQNKNAIPSQGKLYVQFPYWNPDAQGTQYTLQQYLSDTSNAQCQGISSQISTNPSCSFDTSTQILTISNAFSSQVASGSSISFKIKNFKNPITTQTVSGFTVSTGDAITGFIDQAQGTLRMSQVGTILTSTLKVDNSTVQEQTKYRIEFTIPIPLSQGCILEIQFPSQITLDSSILTLVQAFGLPSTQRTLSGSIDRNKNSYVVQSACPSYRDNANSAIVYFTNILNPFYQMTTNTFEIYIYDQNSQMLVSTNGQGPTLTTDPGNVIMNTNLVADITEVNSLTTVLFTIQPLHQSESNGQIILRLPQGQLSVQPATSCTVTSVQTLSSNANCQVQDSGQTIVITQAFTIKFTSKVISFKVKQIQLPPSTAVIDTIQVEFYTFDAGSYQLVDKGSGTGLFQATNGFLLYGAVRSDSLNANDITGYTVDFRIKNPILQGGYVVITLPSQLKIPSLSNALCNTFIGYQAQATCQFTNSSSITIQNGFSNAKFTDTNTILSVKIQGIQNPRSLSTTSSFSIQTFSSTAKLIDVKTDQMTVTMTGTNPITTATVTPSSFVVGATSIYTFSFQAPTSLITGDQMIIQFPPQMNLPLSNTLSSCIGTLNLATSLSCSINGPYGVKIPLNFNKSPLAANTVFSFTLKSASNPSNTQATSLFTAEIQDSQSFQVNQNNANITTFKVQMVQGAQFKVINVSHQSNKPFLMTAFVFTFKLENPMPAGSQVQIQYPDQITADTSYFACTVSTFGATPQCTIEATTQTILVKQATNIDLTAGTFFTVTIQGLINSQKAAATDSFQVQTMNSGGFVINYAYNGLTVTNECDYPCFTCQGSSQPAKCLTCDVQSKYNLLLNSQCIEKCPAGYYSANFQCLKCDKSCAECSTGANKCTKCVAGLYLEGSACVTSCSSDQFIQNSNVWQCQQCSVPCGSCSVNVNNCTSCLQNIQNRLYFQGQCYATCPAGTVSSNGVCVNCDSNCKTCITNTKTCETCDAGLKLNKMSMNCVTNCPSGLTVDTGTTCEYCDLTCKTCDIKDPKKCQSCYSGFSLYSPTGQCITQCPDGNAQVPNADGSYNCIQCSTGCVTCQNSPSYCTKCDDSKNYLFYQFSCVYGQCPSGFTRLSKEKNVCIRDGARCPFGYDFNDFGECVLVAQICKEGYILNHDKTKCIPVPGAYVPLIFLITCIAWTLFIVIKYRKLYSPIEIITQLLVVYTLLQILSYIVMVGLAIALDYLMVKAIHILAIISMFFANIAFTLLFHYKLRKEDSAFKHWHTQFKKSYTIYKFAMGIYSFKIARAMYSQLFTQGHKVHRQEFNAAFEDKYRTIVRPLFIFTVVNFFVQVAPVIVMDIYNFMFIPWGYQIMVMGIDNMIMGIAIFILEIIEFRHYKKLAIEEGNLFKQTQSHFLAKHHDDHNVMSAMDDDNSMMALNKAMINGPPGQALGETIMLQNESRKSYGKKNSAKQQTEKEILEKLVRKLNEEHKFNKILDDDDEFDNEGESYLSAGDHDDIEKMKPKRRLTTEEESSSLLNKPVKRMDEAREKVEDKLSFRNVKSNKLTKSVMQQRIHNDLQSPLFTHLNQSQIVEANNTLDLSHTPLLQDIQEKSQNMESARTEKFQHQTPTKDTKKLSARAPLSQRSAGIALQADLDDGVRLGLHRVDFDSPQRNQEQFELFKEEFKEKLKQRNIVLQKNVRETHSCDDNIMREWYDDLGPESDFNPDDISHESFPNHPLKLQDAEYLARLELFRELMKSKYQYSNCYTHINDPANQKFYNLVKSKNVTRRTQTYEKDIGIGYDPFAKDDNYLQFLDDEFIAELDIGYTQDLISNVIDQISDEDSFIEQKQQETKEDKQEGDDTSNSSFDFEKIKRSKKRKRDVQFDLDDIMGMFDIDDFGNIILNRETMRDNLNRRINKNGYLIDYERNIINQDGDIIFEANELDEDEEIPLPYRFEKRKKQLLKQEEKFINEILTEKNFDLESILQGEEDKIEEEFQKLKDFSRPSSMGSLIGDLPVKFEKNSADNDATNQENEGQLETNSNPQMKNDNSASKREKDLAKAYGGKPPKGKKKKKNKKRKLDDGGGSGDRLPTDRMYPFLQQEEERVKRMAMISYGIDTTIKQGENARNNQQNTQETKDFESFFKEQMQEIQQFRQVAKDEYSHQIQSMNNDPLPIQNIDFYQGSDDQTALKRLDSATTDKTFDIIETYPQLIPLNQQEDSLVSGTLAVGMDPISEIMAQDAERANKFFQKIQRPKNNQSAMIHYNKAANNTSIGNIQSRLNQTATSNFNLINNPQSALSLNSNLSNPQNIAHPQYQPDELSNFIPTQLQEPQESSNIIRPQPFQKKFDFYLPNTTAQQARLKKNLQKDKEKKDISFSNIGRMQVYGGLAPGQTETGGKIKGLEKVYLQKYPVAPKPNAPMNDTRTLQSNANQGNRRKLIGAQRSNTINDNYQPQLYRPSQTFFPDNYQQINEEDGISQRVMNQDLVEFSGNINGSIEGTGQLNNTNFANNQNNGWI